MSFRGLQYSVYLVCQGKPKNERKTDLGSKLAAGTRDGSTLHRCLGNQAGTDRIGSFHPASLDTGHLFTKTIEIISIQNGSYVCT